MDIAKSKLDGNRLAPSTKDVKNSTRTTRKEENRAPKHIEF